MKDIQKKALKIIKTFPQSKNKIPFLKTKCGKKIFFKVFMRKYGLNGQQCNYSTKDIIRRIRFLECFDYLLKQGSLKYKHTKNNQKYFILDTIFFRFILIETKHKNLELLSFYFLD